MQRIWITITACWSLAPASGAGFPLRLAASAGNAGAGCDKRRVNKREAKVPPVLLSIRYWIDILSFKPLQFRTCFYQRGTRWGVVYLSKLSINSFASVSAFSCPVPEKRRCYADRGSWCLRPAFGWDRQVKHRQSEGFCVIQRPLRMASIMARVSLMEIRLPGRSSRC